MTELRMDPIGTLAEKALSRCTTHDWREALEAARMVVEEAGTGLATGSVTEERMAALVALRIIQTWMAAQP